MAFSKMLCSRVVASCIHEPPPSSLPSKLSMYNRSRDYNGFFSTHVSMDGTCAEGFAL